LKIFGLRQVKPKIFKTKETTFMFKGFRAYELAEELYKECEHIPAKGYIKDQLNRASLSIVLNLAEGTGKPTKADRRRFYGIALGSLRETQAILSLLNQRNTSVKADRLAAHVYRLVYPK
jgi:four helix bundle protein